uniref:peptidylprolyl isomerase n=1 Tax=Astyanax mexicanus TaxID=7994 RepID=A0A8B9RDX7_ASTMX
NFGEALPAFKGFLIKKVAKLASLFGLDQAESQGNESFQFTAPKQPKKPSATAGAFIHSQNSIILTSSVLPAVAIYYPVFFSVNGQYVKQGKLGAAVLGNHVTKEYKILLYGSQQKHITTARIHPGFILTVQSGNYITFYDDQRQNWSLKFDPEKAGLDFCKEVCLAKFNSRTCVDGLVVQDLLQGEGMAVDVGDTVEVAFSGWLLQNHAVGQMFDSNIGKNKLQRVRLGSGKVLKGWEDGMVGMRKRGRRLLIIPPGMGHGLKGVPSHVPSTSTLVYDVEIHQVKFSKDEDCFSSGSADSTTASPVPLDSSALESTDQSAVSNPDEAKAKLISRMAKMGQPMLPFLKGAIPVQPEQEKVSGLKVVHLFFPVLQFGYLVSVLETRSDRDLLKDLYRVIFVFTIGILCSVFDHQPYTASQLHPFASVFPSQYQTPYQGDSFLLTETRQHNTEVRLAVGKVADRLDQLASKVENLQKQGFLKPSKSREKSRDWCVNHSFFFVLLQENSSLKKEVLERDCKVEEQTRKIGELIEQRQRYMEQSNLLMEQSNSTQQTCSQQNNTRLVLLKTEHEKVWFVLLVLSLSS